MSPKILKEAAAITLMWVFVLGVTHAFADGDPTTHVHEDDAAVQADNAERGHIGSCGSLLSRGLCIDSMDDDAPRGCKWDEAKTPSCVPND